jgi:hypothetical protein
MANSSPFGTNQGGSSAGNFQVSVFNYESDFQLDAVFRDFPFIIHLELLILDPCGLEMLEGFVRTSYANIHGILKTLW